MRHRRLLLHLLFWTLYLLSQGFIWMNAFVSETVIVSPETGQEIITRSTFPGTLGQSLLAECFALPGRLLAVYVNLYVPKKKQPRRKWRQAARKNPTSKGGKA
ncbi:MAG: hypothetical protein ACKV1O_11745 [Saprospiraceae bacterium]